MSIDLAESIRQLLAGIKDLGGSQILLVLLIVECLCFAWVLLRRHKATIAYMGQQTKAALASMEEQRKLTIDSLEQTKLMIASLETQQELNRTVLELNKAVLEMKKELERMALEQGEAQW